jgi:hypothetical protein
VHPHGNYPEDGKNAYCDPQEHFGPRSTWDVSTSMLAPPASFDNSPEVPRRIQPPRR